jgi:hypothetical protein
MIANFGLQIIVSLATAAPPRHIQEMVDDLRLPVGEMSEQGELIRDRVPTPAPAPAGGT